MRRPKSAEAFRIWQGGFSGEWFAGWGRRRFPDDPKRQDLWEQVGEWREDVTVDIERIIAAALEGRADDALIVGHGYAEADE